jgi:hypothetical protein
VEEDSLAAEVGSLEEGRNCGDLLA